MKAELPSSAENLAPAGPARASQAACEAGLKIFAQAPAGLALVRAERFVQVNDCFESLFGWPAGALDGQPAAVLWSSPRHHAQTWAEAAPRLAQGEALELELPLRRRDGSRLWCRLRARRLADGDTVWLVEDIDAQHRARAALQRRMDERGKALASANAQLQREIEDRRHAEDRVRHLADHDPLTGLANRPLLVLRIEEAIAAAAPGEGVAVLFMDLDRFKAINDSLGHLTGDRLLQAVAQRVQSCLRAGDTVARLGGDEFVIVLPALRTPAEAAQVAAHLIQEVARPYPVGPLELRVTPSVGISLCPEHGAAAETLIGKAGVAMYQAKAQGRRQGLFFDGHTDGTSSQRLLLENELWGALERGELELHYQPRYDLESGLLSACEALLRWNHPVRGPIGPAEFVPLAEESGLIVQIGEWVLREACRQIRAWQDRGLEVCPIAINLSARQFHSLELVAMIRSVLAETGIEPRLLEVEITETTLMHNTAETQSTLAALSALGIKMSVDDFGTGYSSLAYLKRFPVDLLKIDSSFVRDLAHDTEDAIIVSAIIGLARNLQLRVVAEGVETPEQVDFLMRRGCDEVQGFLFGRPLPPAEAERLFRPPLPSGPPTPRRAAPARPRLPLRDGSA